MHRLTRRNTIMLATCVSLLVCGGEARSQQARNGGDFSSDLNIKKLPEGELLVKGAWASASDSTTPIPEDGRFTTDAYFSSYFGLNYPLPDGWVQKYAGPPPSDSGYYVLAQLAPLKSANGATRGSILVAAQDLFFTRTAATNALELISFSKEKLGADYKVERGPEPVAIAGRTFVRFDYGSPVAELHWHVLATEIRCHVIKFVFMSKDTKFTDTLIREVEKVKLPAEAGAVQGTGGGNVPVCVKDYATDANLMERRDPYFEQRRFNAIPARIIIDKQGKVKHIHFSHGGVNTSVSATTATRVSLPAFS